MPRLRPPSLDVLLAGLGLVLLYLDAEFAGKGRDIDALGLAAAALCALPVAWRSRATLPALAASIAGVFGSLETLCPVHTVVLPPAVILFTLAATSTRRRSAYAAAAMVPIVLLGVGLYSPHGVLDVETPKNLGLLLLPIALGAGLRDRRLYVQALHERVAHAERTRDEEARRRVGEERLRIAREVHDVVAHSMVAINVQAGVGAHLLRSRASQDAAADALTEIKRVSGEALADLRATLGVLREEDAPAPVRPAQGLAALEELGDGVRAAGIEVTLDVDDGGRPVPSAVEAAVHRIVQEALTNVLRHARATHAAVRVAVRAGAVHVEVADDGIGGAAVLAAATAGGSGNGLRGMRERAEAVGGEVDAGAAPDGGWRVRARLPLPA